VTTKVTVQPGAPIHWHTHHGPVFVTIVKGELTYVSSEGCTKRRYPAGNAFIDPGHGHVHAAFNSAPVVTEFVATFFEAPTGDAPITIPADGPADCKIPTNWQPERAEQRCSKRLHLCLGGARYPRAVQPDDLALEIGGGRAVRDALIGERLAADAVTAGTARFVTLALEDVQRPRSAGPQGARHLGRIRGP
jgi:hypothetical protein